VDGLEAFNKLGGSPFDALVSDIMMPNMDGLALTEKIRQDKKYKEMPVILVTSLASNEDRQRGMEAGANAYISKPSFDQKVLLDTLRRLI
jgi:two-component system chemotaxis sensor kinase CheA